MVSVDDCIQDCILNWDHRVGPVEGPLHRFNHGLADQLFLQECDQFFDCTRKRGANLGGVYYPAPVIIGILPI